MIGFLVVLASCLFCFRVYKFSSGGSITKPYTVLRARFSDIEGVNIGTPVKIGGVKVGMVKDLKLDDNLQVIVYIIVSNGVNLPEDSSISVISSGLLGAKYLSVEIGGDDEMLQNNDFFQSTKSALNFEGLVGSFVSGKTKK